MDRNGFRTVAVIPARWASTRFPGKPLADLAGRPMIAHVVEGARSATAVDEVIVATDDERVAAAASAAGATAVMTGACRSGTDRVAEAVAGREGFDLVLNVQGDEPLLAGANIDALITLMRTRQDAAIGTLCRPMPVGRLDDPNAVKVVQGRNGNALYFSRAAIPFPRDAEAAAGMYRLHLGIYAFRPGALARFVELAPSPLERAEGLEQLRALENGMSIVVAEAPCDAWGVDTPDDLERVREILEGSSQDAGEGE